MKWYLWLIASICFFLPKPVLADVIWPVLLLKSKIQALFSFWLLLITYLAELILMRLLLPSKSFLKITVTTIFMNVASAFVGLGLLFLVDAILATLQYFYMTFISSLYSLFQELAFNFIYIIVIYFFSVLINAFVEGWIAHLYFPEIDRKKLFWYLVLINAVSVGIGIFGLLAYEYWFGVVKVKAGV